MYFLCDNIWLENFLFHRKTCFPRKRESYLFSYNAILKIKVKKRKLKLMNHDKGDVG